MSSDTQPPATPVTAVEIIQQMRVRYRPYELEKSPAMLASEEGRIRYAMREAERAVVEHLAKELGVK